MVNQKLKIVTTSWDDGHKLDLKLAKLLKKYAIKGTFYIAPKNRQWDRKELLTDKQIKKLSSDFEIGGHTLSHPLLTKVNETEAFQEITDGKNHLEKLLEKKVKMFSYPSGLYDQKIKKMVKKAGFLGARNIKTFRTAAPKNFFEFATTNHTVNRNIGYSLMLALANNPRFIPFVFTKDWVSVSCKIFDMVQKYGGIWHLWGHSWQIEQKSWWDKLEKVLSSVSKRKNFQYLSNGEVLEYCEAPRAKSPRLLSFFTKTFNLIGNQSFNHTEAKNSNRIIYPRVKQSLQYRRKNPRIFAKADQKIKW